MLISNNLVILLLKNKLITVSLERNKISVPLIIILHWLLVWQMNIINI